MSAATSTATSPATADPARAEAFADRFMGLLNDSALALMVSIGHRTGLFDAMRTATDTGAGWLTSTELAAGAELDERYVREWLGAMATGRFVDVQATGSEQAPGEPRFRLPIEHAALLTRAAGADNLAVFTQYIPLLGAIEDDMIACFRNGGGVPYERFPRFHDVMAEDSGQSVVSMLHTHVVPLIPGLHERLAEGIRVLDVGSGRGRVLLELAKKYPASTFVGMDLSLEATERAADEAAALGLGNVQFMARDLSDFDQTAEPEAYDLVTTFDAVHDQARPLEVLRGIQRTVRPDGVYLMQDIRGSSHVHRNLDHPTAPFLYTISCLHCMTVSLAQDGEGLGAMWGEEKTREYLGKAGFREVETKQLAHDFQNNWYVVRR